MKIRKALIPIAGLGTRFLPLSKVLPKELWPLVDKPVIQYIIEELLASGIKEIVFINRPDKKETESYFKEYFKKCPELEEILKSRNKKAILEELKNIEDISKKISFSAVYQKKPLGDGNALLQAKNNIGKEPCAVSWADDVVESKTPCMTQLISAFNKFKKPIIALARIPKESFPLYGMVDAKKIGTRTYKIKRIVEKPEISDSPSDLAIVGKFVLTPEVFQWLENSPLNKNNETILSEVLNKALQEGQEVYGYEFEGKWLECGNKMAYLKSNFYLSSKSEKFGKELKTFIKKNVQ
jgi:UTP--glucose-1-phosphate uridylyltransferase